jgi:hypothetical protein
MYDVHIVSQKRGTVPGYIQHFDTSKHMYLTSPHMYGI